MIELGLYEQIINKLFEVKLDGLNHQEYFIGKRSITKENVSRYLSRYLYGLFEQVFSQFNKDEESVRNAVQLANDIIKHLKYACWFLLSEVQELILFSISYVTIRRVVNP